MDAISLLAGGVHFDVQLDFNLSFAQIFLLLHFCLAAAKRGFFCK
jgi:hypothetical protein